MVSDFEITRSIVPDDERLPTDIGSSFNAKLFYIDFLQDDLSFDSLTNTENNDSALNLKRLRLQDMHSDSGFRQAQ